MTVQKFSNEIISNILEVEKKSHYWAESFLREGIETFLRSSSSLYLSLEHCGLGRWESTTSSDKI